MDEQTELISRLRNRPLSGDVLLVAVSELVGAIRGTSSSQVLTKMLADLSALQGDFCCEIESERQRFGVVKPKRKGKAKEIDPRIAASEKIGL